jgi:Flp pilus assembly protein TadG
VTRVVSSHRTPRKRQSGQSLVEFALVVPFFLLMMFALIDFSRLLFTYVSIANGAREMARVAAVSTNWSGTTAIAAFNNYTLIAAGQNGATDKVLVRVGDKACAKKIDTGATCTPTPSVCPMPLSLATCSPALTIPPQSGFVEVQVAYTFQFNPLFQNRLGGVVDVSFMRPTAQITTTARAFVE